METTYSTEVALSMYETHTNMLPLHVLKLGVRAHFRVEIDVVCCSLETCGSLAVVASLSLSLLIVRICGQPLAMWEPRVSKADGLLSLASASCPIQRAADVYSYSLKAAPGCISALERTFVLPLSSLAWHLRLVELTRGFLRSYAKKARSCTLAK